MAGLTEFYCGWNEPRHGSQFKWLEYTFKSDCGRAVILLMINMLTSRQLPQYVKHPSSKNICFKCFIVLWLSCFPCCHIFGEEAGVVVTRVTTGRKWLKLT